MVHKITNQSENATLASVGINKELNAMPFNSGMMPYKWLGKKRVERERVVTSSKKAINETTDNTPYSVDKSAYSIIMMP